MGNNALNEQPENRDELKRPKLWGAIYLVMGIASVAFSVSTLIRSFGMIPLYGTVTAAVLTAVLGIFLIIYGIRIFKKDY